MDALEDLSQILKSYREDKHLSQTAYSQELGVAKSTLQKLEQGESVSTQTLRHVVNRIGMELLIRPQVQPADIARKASLAWKISEAVNVFGLPADTRKEIAASMRMAADILERDLD